MFCAIQFMLGETIQYSQQILGTHPQPMGLDQQTLSDCIDACFDCAATCTACADAYLAEDMVADMRHCIRADLDCADICDATGRVISRQTQPDVNLLQAQLQACAAACKACGDECEKHAQMHEHCRVCAEACRRCEQSCNRLLQQLSSAGLALASLNVKISGDNGPGRNARLSTLFICADVTTPTGIKPPT